MNFHVILEFLLLYESFVAKFATIFLFTDMSSLMLQFIGMALEFSFTEFARESLDTLMVILVHFESSPRSESF